MISKKETTDESEDEEEIGDEDENSGKTDEGEPVSSEQTLRQRR